MSSQRILDLFSLEGRVAAVTGASRGIGLACAKMLADAGAEIIGISHSMPEGESELRSHCESVGVAFTPIACDLSDREAVAKLGDHLAGAKVDILVNNGGTIRRAPAVEHPEVDFDYVMEVNLHAVWVLSQKVGAMMLERGSGRIVNMASMLSYQGGINVPGYTSSKHAVAGLTKALANEWAAGGVNINAVAPGYVATDNTAALRSDETRSSEILGRIPAGRWAQADDIAGAVLYLSSTAADYVNGITIPVDGGWLAR